MTGLIKLAFTPLAAGLLVAGCSSVPRSAGFEDVRDELSKRDVQYRVQWNRGSAADRAVAEATRSMLNSELTADESVQIALLNNRNLQAVYEELMIAQADLVAAGLLSNPVFDAELRFFDEGPATELAVAQDFLDLLYLPLRKRVAEAAFAATKLRVAGAVLDLAGEVRMTFVEHQASQDLLEMRRQVLLATEASYETARQMRDAGNITELDLANERALYEQSKLNVAAAEARVLQDRERLNELMGLWGDQTEWQVAARLPDPSLDEVMSEQVERRAIQQSLELAAVRQDIEAFGRVLGIARSSRFVPFLDAGISAEGDPGGEWGVGPLLSFPIPLFNQGQPAVAAAQAEYRRAEQRYAALAVTIRARVRAARSSVIAAQDRVNYYRSVILPLREQIVRETLLQYNAMQVGPFQLLIAKQQQIDAGAEYIETLEEYWLARSELEQILSGQFPRGERQEFIEARSAVRVPGGAMPSEPD